MSRLATLKAIIATPKGVSTTAGVAILFLLLAHILNGNPDIITHFSTLSMSYLIPHYTFLTLLSVLLGLVVTVMIYRIRVQGFNAEESATTSFVGILSLLGTGCAGCVAGVIPGVLATLGVSINFLALPLLGLEFILLSCILLSGVLHWMLSPVACSIQKS